MTEPAPRLLGTLLGDYWFWRREHLPSAALVDLLREFGLSESAARAAIQRAAGRGLVVTSKNGRRTAYGVPARTHRLVIGHLRRLLEFGAGDRNWDGRWTFAMFSVPEARREDRRTLRSRLRWLGFGPLYDGVWVSPWDRADDALHVLHTLGVGTATVTRAEVSRSTPEAGNPLHAWDLRALRQAYADFIDRYARVRERVCAGDVGPRQALVERTRIMTEWREFPDTDPDLPAELLPADWPRLHARRCFLDVYDALGPVAEQRFRQVVVQHAPELAELAAHRTSTDITRGAPEDPATLADDEELDWAGPLGRQ